MIDNVSLSSGAQQKRIFLKKILFIFLTHINKFKTHEAAPEHILRKLIKYKGFLGQIKCQIHSTASFFSFRQTR